jgi:hypothetical protein
LIEERKNWKKFGAVKDVPLGMSEKGVTDTAEAKFEPPIHKVFFLFFTVVTNYSKQNKRRKKKS